MMKGEYQGELFREYPRKKGGLLDLAKKIMPPHRHVSIMVPLENAVIAGIVVICFLILSFALGVEKGKRQAMHGAPARQVKTAELPKTAEALPGMAAEPKSQAAEAGQAAKAVDKDAPYTIQLISYKSKDLAEKQVSSLKKRGYEGFVIQNRAWYQVCVGKYDTREAASRDHAEFDKEFKGCFIRRR